MAKGKSKVAPGRGDTTKEIAVILPVFNDWEAFRAVVARIDACFAGRKERLHIIAVNDGSNESFQAKAGGEEFSSIISVKIVSLTVNLGHQRAIAVGLTFAQQLGQFQSVAVMDADGEDRPEDLVRLLELGGNESERVLFAGRAARSEGPVFRACYRAYKLLFRLLTGKKIEFGNFCLIPGALLERVISIPDIWNHFPAGVIRSRTAYAELPCERGVRLHGQPKMNLTSLVIHGLSAIAVFVDVVAVRLILFSLISATVPLLGVGIAGGIRLFADLAAPGWATAVILGLVIMALVTLGLSALLALITLSNRAQRRFIPRKDSPDFIHRIDDVYAQP